MMALPDNLLTGGEKRLREFFSSQRKKRMPMLISLCNSSSDAEEVFNDAFMELYEKAKAHALPVDILSVENYFYGICHNQALKRVRDSKHKREMFAFSPYDISRLQSLAEYDDNREDTYQKLYKKVQALPEPCNTILWAFYRSQMPYEEIAAEMGYNSPTVAKVKKSQCLTRLRKSYGVTKGCRQS